MNLYLLFLIFLLLLGAILVYFKLADKFGIIDRPNDRSLHTVHTIRGGGIIFMVAVILHALFFKSFDNWFLTGFLLVSLVSFIDDTRDLPNRIRLAAQFTAIVLLLIGLGMEAFSPLYLLLVLIVAAGALNAYNFMDGINGITGGYSLIALITLFYINNTLHILADDSFFYVIILALLIFNFFNFRKKAICFAGDVGSISMAYIIIALILKAIFQTGNLMYVMLLAVYGVDSVLTIVHRIWLRENIFRAHRIHLFQVIVSNGGVSHLKMSSIYMLIQLMVNAVIISIFDFEAITQVLISGSILFALALAYFLVKRHYYLKVARNN